VARPTIRQLSFLVMLEESGGFHLAADAIGVTQPTLSAGIRELEGMLDTQLVDRSVNPVQLTPAGAEIARRARIILADTDELVSLARQKTEPLLGSVRVGIIPTIAPALLPPLVKALRQHFPGCQLQVGEEVTERVIEGLNTHKFDLGIIALPYGADGISTLAAYDEEFRLVMSPSHPLAKVQTMTLDDVADDEWLLLEDGHCLRDHVLAVCRASGRSPSRRALGATSLVTLARMAGAGHGVTVAPASLIDAAGITGDDVVVRAFTPPVMGRAVGVAWRTRGHRAQDAQALCRLLEQIGA
jgi:LysR family transcriptional regulator, hydrogen peroxide-inducible genes activator